MGDNTGDDRAAARSFRVPRRFWRLILFGVAFALVLRFFLVQVFTVDGESMEPTLASGERVLVWKPDVLTPPLRGEVIVFDGTGSFVAHGTARPWWEAVLSDAPSGSNLFIKRIIAVGGDHLVCCDASGLLVLNGKRLYEPYLTGPTDQVAFDVIVPAGYVFVLGDNRAISEDSRALLGRPGGGMISSDRLLGRVFAAAVWPARIRIVD